MVGMVFLGPCRIAGAHPSRLIGLKVFSATVVVVDRAVEATED
jgi:hypothetical protein